MKYFAGIVVLALVAAASSLSARQDRSPTAVLDQNGRTIGHLSADKSPMPSGLTKGADGPADVYRVTLKRQTDLQALVDCDACFARLVITSTDARVTEKASGYSAYLYKTLPAGDYNVWVGSGVDQSSAYALTLSTEGSKLTSQLKQFPVLIRWVEGTKPKSTRAQMRLGIEELSFSESGGLSNTMIKDTVVRHLSYAAITGGSTASVSAHDFVFGGHTQESKVTIKTATDYVVVQPPGELFDIIIAELELKTGKKIGGL